MDEYHYGFVLKITGFLERFVQQTGCNQHISMLAEKWGHIFSLGACCLEMTDRKCRKGCNMRCLFRSRIFQISDQEDSVAML